MNYRIDVAGYDGIFQRAVIGTGQIASMVNQNGNSEIIVGFELFIKYLGWIMIPNFIIFLPFGIIQFFKHRKIETNFIIVFSLVCSIPILYAYLRQAQDTRYLYFLFPIFSLISLYSVKSYVSKFTKKNIILSIIIIGIFVGSISFYEFTKIDYEKEREFNEIAKSISITPSGLNFHPTQTRYIGSSEIPNEWPFLFYDKVRKTKVVSTNNHENLENFISDSRKELTHLIVNENLDLPEFLQDVYYNEEKYEYLIKEFDSKEIGFEHHIKLFKIDFQKFDSLNHR